ncbi:MAG: hypothetical protein R3F65_18150 [bacterium]
MLAAIEPSDGPGAAARVRAAPAPTCPAPWTLLADALRPALRWTALLRRARAARGAAAPASAG